MGFIQQDLRYTPLGHACLQKPSCPSIIALKYRRIDGSCNNHFNSLRGASLTPYSRLLPPNYADGKSRYFFEIILFRDNLDDEDGGNLLILFYYLRTRYSVLQKSIHLCKW